MKVIHKGENLLIFSEGTTIHDGAGYHDGLPAHAHAGTMIGVRTGDDVVPVFCDGRKPFHKTTHHFRRAVCAADHGTAAARPKNCRPSRTMSGQAYALGGQAVGGAPL